MCGIVAYIGKEQAFPIILKGLKRLEYRGYDSAGVALINQDQLNVFKKAGKVSNLEEFMLHQDHKGIQELVIHVGPHTEHQLTRMLIPMFLWMAQ